MKQINILPHIVVPLLLFLVAAACYLSIVQNWSFEIASYGIFLFTTLYILFFEQVIPFRETWKIQKAEVWSDLRHLIFSTAPFDALGKTISLSLILYLKDYLFETKSLWAHLPFPITFIVANLVGELLPYIYHRISHIGKTNSRFSQFMWKTHSIHHLPTALNWFKTNWIHPINMFLNSILKMLPLLLLGFSEEIVFLVGISHVVIAYISHANIQTQTGILDYLIVTPKIHQFHHSKKLVEAKNFGNILPFWDLIFGTYYNRKGEVENVGVVEADYYYPKHKNYLSQLAFPFMASKRKITERENFIPKIKSQV